MQADRIITINPPDFGDVLNELDRKHALREIRRVAVPKLVVDDDLAGPASGGVNTHANARNDRDGPGL
jgi:hypothetical protein